MLIARLTLSLFLIQSLLFSNAVFAYLGDDYFTTSSEVNGNGNGNYHGCGNCITEVPEEDCDDGNHDPEDGCDECKFTDNDKGSKQASMEMVVE